MSAPTTTAPASCIASGALSRSRSGLPPAKSPEASRAAGVSPRSGRSARSALQRQRASACSRVAAGSSSEEATQADEDDGENAGHGRGRRGPSPIARRRRPARASPGRSPEVGYPAETPSDRLVQS